MLVFPSNPDIGDVFGQWMWDGNKWTRASGWASFTLEGLSDVEFTEPVSAGELLGFSDGAWRNVTDLLANTLSVGGDATVHGALTLGNAPVTAMQAATKQYVDDSITAIPAPALAALSDTSLSNLAAGQALTFNGSAWVNANVFSPVVVNGAPGWTSLAVNASGQTAIDIWRTDLGVFIYGRDQSNGQQFVIEDIPQFVRFNVDNAASGMLLSTNGGSRLLIRPTGEVEINPFNQSNNGTALWVNGPTGTGQWAQVIQGGAGAQGFWVRAGTDSGNYCALFRDVTATTTYFQVMGDGSGMLGPPAARLNWNSAGRFAFGTAVTDPTKVKILGEPNAYALRADAGWSTTGGTGWAAVLTNIASNTGCANGVAIQAGTNRSDVALQVKDAAGNSLLALDGFGFWDISLPAASGYTSFTIWTPNPAGSNLMQIVGTPYNQVRFPNAQPTAAQYNTAMLVVSNLNQLCYFTSSARNKQDMRTMQRTQARALLGKLRAVTFRSKCEIDDPNITHCGLIAEEVASVAPALASYDSDGLPTGVAYNEIMAMMIPLLQELLGMEEQPC